MDRCRIAANRLYWGGLCWGPLLGRPLLGANRSAPDGLCRGQSRDGHDKPPHKNEDVDSQLLGGCFLRGSRARSQRFHYTAAAKPATEHAIHEDRVHDRCLIVGPRILTCLARDDRRRAVTAGRTARTPPARKSADRRCLARLGSDDCLLVRLHGHGLKIDGPAVIYANRG